MPSLLIRVSDEGSGRERRPGPDRSAMSDRSGSGSMGEVALP
jgi:hypothetical protein